MMGSVLGQRGHGIYLSCYTVKFGNSPVSGNDKSMKPESLLTDSNTVSKTRYLKSFSPRMCPDLARTADIYSSQEKAGSPDMR